jgi:hypothetical protein
MDAGGKNAEDERVLQTDSDKHVIGDDACVQELKRAVFRCL